MQILTVSEMPQAEKFLPDPPSQTDPLFFNDMVQYQKGKQLRDTPRGAQAVEDASTKVAHYLKRFGEVMGREMTPEEYPCLASYVLSVYTAARQSISSTKTYYSRMRPYQFFREPSSTPEKEEVNDFTSYPSGHTVTAFLAAELVRLEFGPWWGLAAYTVLLCYTLFKTGILSKQIFNAH